MAQNEKLVYQPLAQREIRLVTLLPGEDSAQISCTLYHTSLGSQPDFEALSYVWGSDDLYASILINGKAFSVRRNLWLALYRFRGSKNTTGTAFGGYEAPRPLTLWIDAICINQDDIPERNAQVQIMGNIFEKAKRLRIWLGEQTPNTIIALKNFSVADEEPTMCLDCPWLWKRAIQRISEREFKAPIERFFDTMIGLLSRAKRVIHEAGIVDGPEQPDLALEWMRLKEQWAKTNDDQPREEDLKSIRDILSRVNSICIKAKSHSIPRYYGGSVTGVGLVGYDNRWEEAERVIRIILNAIDTKYVNNKFSEGSIQTRCREGILEICHRDYWTRLWVIQEAILGLTPIIYCGTSTLLWSKFEDFLNAAIQQRKISYVHYPSGYTLSPELAEELRHTPAVQFLKAFQVTKSAGIHESSLRSLITCFSKSQAKDPKDMVYGLLALSTSYQDFANFAPDYSKPIHELYVKVLKASIWRPSVLWRGDDHYLVSFSHLLQRVFSEPFWDKTCDKPIAMRQVIPSNYNLDEILLVRGLLGKRMQWYRRNFNTISATGTPTKPEPEGLTSLGVNRRPPQLTQKDRAWLQLGSPSKPKDAPPIRSSEASSITANDSGEQITVYDQKFLAFPYFLQGKNDCWLYEASLKGKEIIHEREGSAVLSDPCEKGEFLCFFKDCDVTAIVREKSPRKYCITGHAIVDRTQLEPLLDWTVECDVEMTFEELQMLTM